MWLKAGSITINSSLIEKVLCFLIARANTEKLVNTCSEEVITLIIDESIRPKGAM